MINYYLCQSFKKSEISNLFTPLLQMKLFWRNNIAFTKKCTVFMHNILLAIVRLGWEAAVWRGSEKYVKSLEKLWETYEKKKLWEKPWKIRAEKFIFLVQACSVDKNEPARWCFSMILIEKPLIVALRFSNQ